jgi:putative hydrolase of the HAD superfamily
LKFSAVAFDLDGTLYPNIELYSRLVPFLLKEHRLLSALDKARKQLRKSGGYGADGGANSGADFYDTQAKLMGEILREAPEKIKEKTERLIYRGWEPFFKKIKLFSHVIETLDSFKNNGIKMGLLSDFPPETKLRYLKIDGYWNTVICSEETGFLKPDTRPFQELAAKMAAQPGEILYVGNSVRYDVEGAHKAGMKTALIKRGWKSRPENTERGFIFNDYRQLCDYVLG